VRSMGEKMFGKNTVTTDKEALSFVNKYGVVTLFPIRGWRFPNLYQAVVGQHKAAKLPKMWLWADSLSEKKRMHYGKLVRNQSTLLSLEMFPCFYRMYGRQKVGDTAQKILEFLKRHGATSTTILKRHLNLTGKANRSKFAKAIDELQTTFSVAIVARDKAPRMTHSYDLMERWMPELVEAALHSTEVSAREQITAKLLGNNVFDKREHVETFLNRL